MEPDRMAKRPRLAEGVTDASAGSGEWAQVIIAVQPAIVALKITFVCAFEDDQASMSMGTGFVVDKQQGLILTNRHITGVGPVRGIAIFDRHEELEVEVVYRDPIHDFGFFRYDPSKLRLTGAAEIVLEPNDLKVGTEIRVVGNDAGEKLQILSGTIARTDRNVPEFNTVYNDENTYYAGAGAGTSGGSSGSPVLNKAGRAIALNAAGTEGAASAFFLPLDRVCYTLKGLREGRMVTRGTCMAAFHFKAFDELKKVGLHEQEELEVRGKHEDATGMLIVDSVLSEQKSLRAGDILLKLQGEVCITFVQLEGVLDAHVGDSIELVVNRGGEKLVFQVDVADLHSLIPRSYVELGMDVLHGLGYHAARRANLPLDSGIYLARAGYVFESLGADWGCLITSVNGKPTPSPEALVKAIEDIPDRQYFPVQWYDLRDFRRDRTLKSGFAKMSRAWSPLRIWRCSNGTRESPEIWDSRDMPLPSRPPRVAEPPGRAAMLTGGDRLVRLLQTSLVTVRFRTEQRFCTEALDCASAEGVGLLVDAKRGLVVTDRHSAPQSLGDIEITLGGCATVDGEVIFIHPQHNLAFIRCDPEALAALLKGKLPLRSAKFAKGKQASLRAGENVYFVGFDNQNNAFSAEVRVAAVYLPSGKDEFPPWHVPRFHERNLEIIVLADTPEDARGGVLCNKRGEVRALFAAFDWQGARVREETTEAFGIATSVFAPLLDAFQKEPNLKPQVRCLDVEVSAVDMATLARGAAGKMPSAWMQSVLRRCGQQGQVARAIRVSRVLPTGAADGKLLPSDVLLSIDGQTIACALDVEEALWPRSRQKTKAARGSAAKRTRSPRAAACPSEAVAVRVFREGWEIEVMVTPSLLGSEDDAELVIWAGLVLRKTPRCILERCGPSVVAKAGGVFVQHVLGGSPADSQELNPHCFLKEMDGRQVHHLSDVLQHSRDSREKARSSTTRGDWVRLLFLDLTGKEHVRAVQPDLVFFPTLDLSRCGTGRWQCTQQA